MPRIDFTAPLTATDAEDRRLTDWSILSPFVGRSFDETELLGFFGQYPEEIPIAALLELIGDTRILANDKINGLMAQSSARSTRPLNAEELEILQKHVVGQWSDGFGESLELDSVNFFIDYEQVDRQQIDDGIASQGSGTHDLIPAIRARDINKVREALAQGENVHAVIGGTNALGWAISFADAPIAHLLIDAGVNVNHRAYGFMTALALCAASYPDADAASVASRVLEMGQFEDSEIAYAAEIAGDKKPQLIAVLNNYRNA